ncbi:hypothetical protein HCB39_25865 [Salinispora arenicola]|nr:hypothetical protein [Salinispora arenicola]
MQRQHSGTARKIENCQLAVHLSYASPRVHILVDLASYLPKSWTNDPARAWRPACPTRSASPRNLSRRAASSKQLWSAGCGAGGSPATKPTAVTPHLAAALRCHAGLRPRGRLLAPRPDRTGHPSERTRSPPASRHGRGSGSPPAVGRKVTAFRLGVRHPPLGRRRAPRPPLAADPPQTAPPVSWRSTAGGCRSSFHCWSPSPTDAGASRNPSKPPSHQATKPPSHQATKPASAWTRTNTAAGEPGTDGPLSSSPHTPAAAAASTTSPEGLIPITVNELRRLFYALTIEPARLVGDVIAWSILRRRRQAAAKISHYTRQASQSPETELLLEY